MPDVNRVAKTWIATHTVRFMDEGLDGHKTREGPLLELEQVRASRRAALWEDHEWWSFAFNGLLLSLQNLLKHRFAA